MACSKTFKSNANNYQVRSIKYNIIKERERERKRRRDRGGKREREREREGGSFWVACSKTFKSNANNYQVKSINIIL